ncbi:MAG: class I SAM-dependent methyltransferase [Rhodospirillaceae bacterium]|jgi:ubiquinone/menaquinone biosynthesis C-methylase UbiE|nr:class I SAM-dependent methyltransferase [Rhodospirillaceae bacterium]
MMDRRTLFKATAALSSFLGTAFGICKAEAKDFAFDVEHRGTVGRLERLPNLDLESRDHFFVGIRRWRGDTLVPASRKRFAKIMEANGYDPKEDLPLDKIVELVKDDPLINTEVRIFLDAKRTAHKNYKQEFDNNSDLYLAEMEAYDKRGPGTLELNPDLHIPTYTKHEIHQQPGGYVGSPFSGPVYHHGTNAFYLARSIQNKQDENHAGLASQMVTPEDGRIGRVLDMGCGIGQLSIALKERFPDAEVTGVDVAGPMIRYGHMRAVDLDVEVNFAQRLAEDTQLPGNHVDIVTSYLLHHEITAEATKNVIAEAYRVLRPGGVFFPIDFFTGGQSPTNAAGTFARWIDHRWNNEVWRPEYASVDFAGTMRKVGFDVTVEGPSAWRRRHNILGIKPA